MARTRNGRQASKTKKTLRKKLLPKTSHKAGRPPGTLVHIGKVPTAAADIRRIEYNPQHMTDQVISSPLDCRPSAETTMVSWINVNGVHDLPLLEQIGSNFTLHPLVLEDIVNTEHRPKFEDFDSYLFIVLKMLHYDITSAEIHTEQVSFVLTPNTVLSFQEKQGDVFEGVRERLRNNKGRIRKMGSDYLAYALLDSVVDSYFVILEQIGEQVELLEEELVSRPTPETLNKINHFKREMILLRKAVWPLRELIGGIQRNESALVTDATGIFLRDVYDHTIQILDTVETFRDVLSGLLDLYLSIISNRMNEVMKVLTIIATIFIPLTFIAGIYGMNFDHIPELHWRWSYPALWLIMLTVGGIMIYYFKRKRWL